MTAEAFGRGRAPDGRSSYELLCDRVAGSRRVLDLGCGDGHPLVIGDPVVASNADGRLEVFALFGDGTIRCAWQNVAGNDNDWSAWHSLGVPESSQSG